MRAVTTCTPPDLPGLHSQGVTLEEAAANAHEAVELYVEGVFEGGGSGDERVQSLLRRRS